MQGIDEMIFGVLSKILKITFEPVGVIMFAGMVFALWRNWFIHKNEIYKIIISGLIFMFGWRSCVHLLSSRYCELFIYAGVGFSAYIIFKLPLLLKIKFRQIKFLDTHSRLLIRILTLLLILGCMGKILHYNRYHNYIGFCSKIVKNDAKNYSDPIILDLVGDANRIGFYTGMKVIPYIFHGNHIASAEEIKNAMNKNQAPVIYVYYNTLTPSGTFTASELGLKDENLKFLVNYPRENHKIRYLNVLRYKKEK